MGQGGSRCGEVGQVGVIGDVGLGGTVWISAEQDGAVLIKIVLV